MRASRDRGPRAAAASIALMALGALAPGPAAAAEPPCPVTIPNGSLPPPGGGGVAPGSRVTHGNGLLWTILPDDGVWLVDETAMRPDGSFQQKFVWWRLVVEQTTVVGEDGVVSVESTYAGSLRITGRQLDEEAALVTATTQHEGVHVGSTITFPAGGCWEITGTAEGDVLTFVVYMLPPGEPMPDTALPPPSALPALGMATLLAGVGIALIRPVRR